MTTTATLADVPLDARAHVEVRLQGAVLLVVDQLCRVGAGDGLSGVLKRHRFLGDYLDAILPFVPPELGWADLHAWWLETVTQWELPAAGDLPLCRLGAAYGLDRVALTQLLVAGLVDEDSRFGGVFAELTGSSRRPTVESIVGITTLLFGTAGEPDAALARAIHDGILTAYGTQHPRSEWTVAPLPELWEVLRGRMPGGAASITARDALPGIDDLVTTEDFRQQCAQVGAAFADMDLVLVRGTAGSDRALVAQALAQTAGKGVLHVAAPHRPDLRATAELLGEASRLLPVAAALGAVTVVEIDPMPGESVRLDRGAYRGPMVVVMGHTGVVDGAGHRSKVTLDVPRLGSAGRAQRWRQALGGMSVVDLEGIAAASGLQGRHIDEVVRSAVSLASVRGEAVTLRHVRAASRDLDRRLLEDLAPRLDPAGDWSDVVVGDYTAVRLAELESRCRYRERVADALPSAYSSGTGVGVRALFTGPSGTGKTLAATVLGSRLGLGVHRLDLSAVVDKYIGETEKNLHRVLSAAEELDVVLLIDEGDALLGRRTEVRSANDRFANLETNFLLQRLEHYRGIVVVTTNAPDQVDAAFQRRMDVVVDFLAPSARERADIWRLHLPADHQVSAELVDELVQRCTMTGGQIRNAVLHAVVLALPTARPVSDCDVEQAVASEYQKAGAASPYDPSGRRHGVSHARVFREVVS
ncbi:ATPase family protein associated with various cellular activities (AAA) [Humibacillus xanthopallidus]|uniref:ATPase family protein associated with various cellular activities (AAA) n=1 Tax=Humibacillus xanthopallidus TaxID=412689 RepID=A0A543PWW7_9MICO|nr:AAA family ATPase [Humibacillus xanthopallidus]TQN48571.1 ATPase family protein associated with various cellular activities (AAA) [Humibacillus xanthopallidus]